MDVQQCYKCKEVLPLTSFNQDKTRESGYHPACKTCRSLALDKTLAKERKAQSKQKNKTAYALYDVKKRAKAKGIEFDLSVKDLPDTAVCPVFGWELVRVEGGGGSPSSWSLDRIDSSRGYTKDNVQVLSKKANTMKLDATPEELLMFADWVYQTYKKERYDL
jgi:hypothetical protein